MVYGCGCEGGQDENSDYTCASYTFTLWLLLQCPPTETVPTIRQGEPRTSVSTFTQLLNSELRGIGFIVA